MTRLEMRARLGELQARIGAEEQCDNLAEAVEAFAAVAAEKGEAGDRAEEYRGLLIACWLDELRARRSRDGRDPDDERRAIADLDCPGCGGIFGECGCAEAAAEMEVFDEPPDSARCEDCGERVTWDDAGEWTGCTCGGGVSLEQITTSVYKTTPPGSDGPFREDADERLAALEDGSRPFSLLDVARAAVGPDDPPPVNVEVLRLGPTPETVLVMAELLEHHRKTLRELTTCDFIGDVEEMLHKREPWLFGGDGKPQNLEGDDPGPIAEGLELVEVAPGVEVLREANPRAVERGSLCRVGDEP